MVDITAVVFDNIEKIRLLLAFLVVAVSYFVFIGGKNNKAESTLPPLVGGARPVFGHTAQINKDTHKFFSDATKNYGSIFTVRFLWNKLVVVSGRDLYSDFYKAADNELSAQRSAVFVKLIMCLWGSDDTYLSEVNISFTKKIMTKQHESLIRQQAKTTIDALPQKGTLELQDFARKMVPEMVSRIYIGQYWGDHFSDMFLSIENIAAKIIFLRVVFGDFLPLGFFLKKVDNKRLQVVKDLEPLVKELRSAAPATPFLECIQTFRKSNGQPLSDAEVAMCLNTNSLIASTNTTKAVANLLLLAAFHPEQLEELKKELAVVPFSQSELLNAWALEAARMSGGFINSRRIVGKDGFELGGYYLPPGTVVVLDTKTSILDSGELEDPHLFKPSRFINNKNLEKYAVLNWSYGQHKCPGQIFALAAMKYIFATLLTEGLVLEKPAQEFKAKQTLMHSMNELHPSYKVNFRKETPSTA